MDNANMTPEHNLVEKIRRSRRSFIKKTGKKLIRQLGSFLGKQSTVGDMPVFQTENFDWAKSLEAKVDIIRQELLGVLETPATFLTFMKYPLIKLRFPRVKTGKHLCYLVLDINRKLTV